LSGIRLPASQLPACLPACLPSNVKSPNFLAISRSKKSPKLPETLPQRPQAARPILMGGFDGFGDLDFYITVHRH
jgi:hypothetical protein